MSTKEFNYTREWTDAEAFPLLSFTKNWENPDDYPTIETDEMKVRQDMQSLHDEVKNFLNNELIPRVVEEDATVDAWRASEETRVTNEETRVANEEQRVKNEEHREEVTRDAEAAVVAVENLTADYVELPAGSPVYVEKSVNAEGGIQLTFGLSRGTSGVYVGSGTMPDDANIQIDPSGDPTDTAGLMMLKTYDPTGKAQDIFAYALPANSKGNPDGVASLNGAGKVPVEQLPEISSVKTFEATIGTSWTENEDTGVKTQTVAIAGITAENTAKVDHSSASVDGTTEGYAAFVEEENQYLTYITNGFAETVAGGIKFTIFGDAPTVSIPIVVEVV